MGRRDGRKNHPNRPLSGRTPSNGTAVAAPSGQAIGSNQYDHAQISFLRVGARIRDDGPEARRSHQAAHHLLTADSDPGQAVERDSSESLIVRDGAAGVFPQRFARPDSANRTEDRISVAICDLLDFDRLLLRCLQIAFLPGAIEKLVAKLWMRDRDKRFGPLGRGFAGHIRGSVLGHDVLSIGPRIGGWSFDLWNYA